jgi:hypothetical protein
MIGRSINLKLSGNNKPKEPKQKRKTRVRSSMPEGGEITFDVVYKQTKSVNNRKL